MQDTALKELLDWNHRVVLGDLLAVEAHLAVLGREGVRDSWCVKKHLTHALEHGVREAISHAEALGMDSSRYREFYRELEELLRGVPSIEQVRKLRDKWRVIAGDETLKSECPICRLDVSEKLLKEIEKLSSMIEESMEEAKPAGGSAGPYALLAVLLGGVLLTIFILRRVGV